MSKPLDEQFKLALEGTMALTYFGVGLVCLFFSEQTSALLGIPVRFVYALGGLLTVYGAFRGWRFLMDLQRR